MHNKFEGRLFTGRLFRCIYFIQFFYLAKLTYPSFRIYVAWIVTIFAIGLDRYG